MTKMLDRTGNWLRSNPWDMSADDLINAIAYCMQEERTFAERRKKLINELDKKLSKIERVTPDPVVIEVDEPRPSDEDPF